MKILVTGSAGFLGRNLIARLQEESLKMERQGDGSGHKIIPYDLESGEELLPAALADADLVYHLAGVNRPEHKEEFYLGNGDLTRRIVETAEASGNRPLIVFSSTVHAAGESDYGRSKRLGENYLAEYRSRGGRVAIYRLSNLFGKWSRPNYNSVVATFCHNTARNLPLTISDRKNRITLNYIDDVVDAFLKFASPVPPLAESDSGILSITVSHTISLGELADTLASFRSIRETGILPELSDRFTKQLYSTYLSYLPEAERLYYPELKSDDRGFLFELIKSPHIGQIFVSRTKPGITRGNHYHHTKVEKFCVIEGEAEVTMRLIDGEAVQRYRCSGKKPAIIDIPPGLTHAITNVGEGELITLFWANELFDPAKPDTFFKEVE
jgi:UDP-2-acetamido-2,6-beta-L-arabino-hexul-4-ose reductase